MKKGTVSLGSPGGSSFTSSVSDDFNLSADFNSMPSFTTSADFLTPSSKPVENGQNGNGKSAKEKGDEKQSKKQIEADHSLTNAGECKIMHPWGRNRCVKHRLSWTLDLGIQCERF